MAMSEVIISAVSGLVGVGVGAWLTSRSERAQRKLDFMERRLNEFYAPMLSLRKDIKAKSELRVLIQNAGTEGWDSVAARLRDAEPGHRPGNDFKPYKRLLDYDNRQFREEIIPAYRRMVSLFRDHMSLAFPDTTSHFEQLSAFVSIWDRHLDDSLPAEVLPLLGHKEEDLYPFYANLQIRHDQLVAAIANGKPIQQETKVA